MAGRRGNVGKKRGKTSAEEKSPVRCTRCREGHIVAKIESDPRPQVIQCNHGPVDPKCLDCRGDGIRAVVVATYENGGEQRELVNCPSCTTGKLARIEMNLMDWPVTLPWNSFGARRKILSSYTIQDTSSQPSRTIELYTSASREIGLPFADDEPYLFAALWWQGNDGNGLRDRRIKTHLSPILAAGEFSTGRRTYEHAAAAFRRFAALRIRSSNAIWHNPTGAHWGCPGDATEEFWSIVDYARIQRKDGRVMLELEWSRMFWENVDTGYLKRINVRAYLSLRRFIARRLYLMALKRGRSEISIGLDKAAFHSGIRMEGRARKKIRQQFRQSLQELRDHNLATGEVDATDVIRLNLCGPQTAAV